MGVAPGVVCVERERPIVWGYWMERFRLQDNFAELLDAGVTLPRPTVHQCLFSFQITVTPTAELFFSERNRDVLQAEIVRLVNEITQRTITKQSEDELLLVMRSVYLQYSNNVEVRVPEEVRGLNTLVLDYCVPTIVTNLTQYVQYLREVGRNPAPFPHAENVSTTGMRGYVDGLVAHGPR